MDEQEKKSHASYPFVVLRPIKLENVISVVNFFNMSIAVQRTGWRLIPYGGNGEWHLSFPDAQDQKFYQDDPEGIHNYETKLVRIIALTKELERSMHSVKAEFVEIIDGNTGYADTTGGEWQIKPHESSLIRTKNLEENKF